MASDTIKIPGIGVQKKKPVYLAVSGVVLLGGVAYYRSRKTAAAAAAAATTATDSTQIDPATGFAYGSPEDAQALASDSAYQTPTDYGGGGGSPLSTYPTDYTVNGTTTQFINNAQWEQAAIAFLTGGGAPFADVSAALGAFLTGNKTGPIQQSYIEQAIASEGWPPVSGASGYPPSILTGGTDPGTGTGTAGSGTGTSNNGGTTTTTTGGATSGSTGSVTVTTGGTPPPANSGFQTTTIQDGDTIAKLATKYYGSARAIDENTILAGNPWLNALKRAGHIGVGTPLGAYKGHSVSIPPKPKG